MKMQLPSLKNERGFVLALSLLLLAVCTVVGLAATMTSTLEIEITGSDTTHRQVLYGTEAGASIAMETLLANQAMEAWDDGEFLDTDNRVKIVDGDFLTEGQDSDGQKRWNYWEKFQTCDTPPTKPLDDLRVSGSNDTPATDTNPDIRVRVPGQFIVDIDVDKVRSKHLAGSGAEFGTGSEGLFGSKLVYNFDCIGTLPTRTLTDPNAARAEVMVGYRYVPSGM